MAKQWFFLNLSRMRLLQKLVPVRELFKPAEVGLRFSSGATARSSSEGIKLHRARIKLDIPFYQWLLISHIIWIFHGWLFRCSAPVKLLSDGSALKLVVSTCCELSPGWRFALFCRGELLEFSICSVEMLSFVHCSMMLQEVEKVLQSYLLPGSAAMRN